MLDVSRPVSMHRDHILEAPGLDCDITLLDSVASTNVWVLQQCSSGRQLPFACFAEQQTKGRGRRGKLWVSPSNSNIYMSLALKLDLPVSSMGALSIVIGIAVIRALEKIGVRQAQLKWPNDVLVDDKKIAGILIETTQEDSGKRVVVIGVGLNYSWPVTSTQIPDQPWTDVVSVLKTGTVAGRSYLAGLLLKECLQVCETYPHNKVSLISEYQAKYDVCLHKSVNVTLDNGMKFHGVANGVTAAGEIRVLINGEERIFSSAEVSLRKSCKEKGNYRADN